MADHQSPAVADSGPSFEQLAQFDRAWRSGTVPRLEDFLPSSTGGVGRSADPVRRRWLEALIQIDLEYRWRLKVASGTPGLTKCPRLEDYLARFPELVGAERLALELIGEEYRVRQRWGDCPKHAEYCQRFVQHANQLPELLCAIDRELSREVASGPARGAELESVGGKAREPIASVGVLVEALRRSQLLSSVQLGELAAMQARYSEPRSLATELLRRNWLTPFQVNQILQGNASELVLGPYLLLERLGEGGAGQVFKAKHAKMDRVVALKVVRKELLADAETVARFYREIEIVSRLDHPNVVHAFDAGPAGATHFLAMEYVEGSDLGKMVKRGGPLPVLQACEYLRQAACGLAHAHERGLVHRDIKPHNLIMSLREGRIKLADLGLGRLTRPVKAEVTATLQGTPSTGTLTPENAGMMGTVDYLAPEQALDFHRADIRADIYSLGCTFYYLLAGQPPFADGNLAQKVARHLHTPPPPIEQFRSDLPRGLSAVLSRMLAKQPSDRYQTPAELIAALGSIPELARSLPNSRLLIGSSVRQVLARGRRPASLAAVFLLLVGLVWMALSLGERTAPTLPVSGASLAAARQPALVIACGKGRRIGPGQGVIAGTKQEAVVAEGFGCTLLNGYASDAHFPTITPPHCWWEFWSLRFEVRVPPGTSGTLRLQFIDGDNKNRKQKLHVQDREVAVIQDFSFPGKWIEVAVSPADTKEGKILVRLANLAGTTGNCVISMIEFVPLAPQP
jgi:serine/threonine protein kinase